MKRYASVILLLFVLTCGYHAKAQENEIKVGVMAPEISLPTPQGKIVTLSSLRGNLVLIDFWATWCAPCVEEQPELKRLYDTYNLSVKKGRKLEIYGVSLDSKKPAWEKAIRKFEIKWPQVSDLKFWSSPVAKTYNLEGIPYNVVVDSDGYIIALNLHGKELEDFVRAGLEEK
ncbi:TlpA family protein disulfide reductase [Dyadobacter sediminis]|uniref:TlpA family protein disulfide reductase n=1 Tax=Dyadobacter sediminis TaxID=1493691 RepID=A0A5R9KKI6_9BACT|nr:TlpA disulfide reductase family protein [Dyadobacter sediminis]TLU96629.1 TlpA family protein disulfide reductase [Dyadobacter sediminis]GGB83872.1 hypothetical protein GCM10011325_09300 [Dyadobacter sediminis]